MLPLFHKLVFKSIFFFHKVQNVSPGTNILSIANKYEERLSMIDHHFNRKRSKYWNAQNMLPS